MPDFQFIFARFFSKNERSFIFLEKTDPIDALAPFIPNITLLDRLVLHKGNVIRRNMKICQAEYRIYKIAVDLNSEIGAMIYLFKNGFYAIPSAVQRPLLPRIGAHLPGAVHKRRPCTTPSLHLRTNCNNKLNNRNKEFLYIPWNKL